MDSNKKKYDQLGQSHGSAVHTLRKNIMFSLLAKLNLNTCFQCKEPIKSADDLSVEHKEPWLDSENPKEKFFDLDNIAFSHLSCNCAAARRPTKKWESSTHRNSERAKLRQLDPKLRERHLAYKRA